MKEAVLLELANRWESETHNGNLNAEYKDGPEGHIKAGKDTGRRETLRECADALRTLVSLVGSKE